MKVWSLLGNVNLRETVKQTDFEIQNGRAHKDGILKKFESRFPMDVKMPIQNPAMSADNKNAQNIHTPVGQLSIMDRELMLRAYKHAIEENKHVRTEARHNLEKADQRAENEASVLREKDVQLFRILQTWAKRFHMEKIFHELGIKKLDDFKLMMHKHNMNIDERGLLQRKFFIQQRGGDQNSILQGFQNAKIIENKEELLRLREDFSEKLFINLEEVKQRLKDVNSKQFVLHVQAVHEQTNAKVETALDFGVNPDGSKKSA